MKRERRKGVKGKGDGKEERIDTKEEKRGKERGGVV